MEKIPFEFNNASYNDPVYKTTVTLLGNGNALIEDNGARIVTESDAAAVSREISAAVASAISELNGDFGYDMLPRSTEKLLPLVCSKLSGITLSAIEFSSCCPDDESVAAIVRIKRANAPAPQAAPAAAENAPREASDGDTLVLVSTGTRKIEVINYMVKNFGLGLAAAKKIAESTPAVISEHLTPSQLDMHIGGLSALGAEAEIK